MIKTLILTETINKVLKAVVNGIDGQGGDTYRIDSSTITSIEVKVDGYKSTYVLGVVGDEIKWLSQNSINNSFKYNPR